MKTQIKSLAEMDTFSANYLSGLAPGSTARVVGLSGDLGSGKTTFVQGVARALGIPDQITSPTFVIMKSYELPASSFKKMIHIDAYRLESARELEDLRFNELAHDPSNLIFIEWPERVKEILPPGKKELFFAFIDESNRLVAWHN